MGRYDYDLLPRDKAAEQTTRARKSIYGKPYGNVYQTLKLGATAAGHATVDEEALFKSAYKELQRETTGMNVPKTTLEDEALNRMRLKQEELEAKQKTSKESYAEAIREQYGATEDIVFGTPEQQEAMKEGRPYKLTRQQALQHLIDEKSEHDEDVVRLHDHGHDDKWLTPYELEKLKELTERESYGPVAPPKGLWPKLVRTFDYAVSGVRAGGTELLRQAQQQRMKEAAPAPQLKKENPWWSMYKDSLKVFAGPVGWGMLAQETLSGRKGGVEPEKGIEYALEGKYDWDPVMERAKKAYELTWNPNESENNLAIQLEQALPMYQKWAEQTAAKWGHAGDKKAIEKYYNAYLAEDLPARYPNLAQAISDGIIDPTNLFGGTVGKVLGYGAKQAGRAVKPAMHAVARAAIGKDLYGVPSDLIKHVGDKSRLGKKILRDAATPEEAVESLGNLFTWRPETKKFIKANPEYLDTMEKLSYAMRAGDERGMSKAAVLAGQIDGPLKALNKLSLDENRIAHALANGNYDHMVKDLVTGKTIRAGDAMVTPKIEAALEAAQELRRLHAVTRTEAGLATRWARVVDPDSGKQVSILEEGWRKNYNPEKWKVDDILNAPDDIIPKAAHPARNMLRQASAEARVSGKDPLPLLGLQWATEWSDIMKNVATGLEVKETVESMVRNELMIKLLRPPLELAEKTLEKATRHIPGLTGKIMRAGNSFKAQVKKLDQYKMAIAGEEKRLGQMIEQSGRMQSPEAVRQMDMAAEASQGRLATMRQEFSEASQKAAATEKKVHELNDEFFELAVKRGEIKGDIADYVATRGNIEKHAAEMTAKTGVKYVPLDEAANDVVTKIIGIPDETIKGQYTLLVPEPVATRTGQLIGQLNVPPDEAYKTVKAFGSFIRGINQVCKIGVTVGGGLAFAGRNLQNTVGLHPFGLGARVLDPKLQYHSVVGATAAALESGKINEIVGRTMVRLNDGSKATLGQVMKAAQEYGRMSMLEARYASGASGRMAKIPEAFVNVLGNKWAAKLARKKIPGAAGEAVAAGLRAASPEFVARASENYQHFTTFLGFLDNLTPEGIHKAVELSSKFSGNYNRISPFEKHVLQDNFGFYSWTKFIVPHMIKMIVQQPEKIAAWFKYDRMRRYKRERYPIDERVLSGFQKSLIAHGVGGMAAKEELQETVPEGYEVATVFETPLTTLAPLVSQISSAMQGNGMWGPSLADNLGFAVQAAAELIFGYDLYTGEQIPFGEALQRQAMTPIKRPTEFFLNMSRLYLDEGDIATAIDPHLRFAAGRDLYGLDHQLFAIGRSLGITDKQAKSLGGMFGPKGTFGERAYLTHPLLNLSRYQKAGLKGLGAQQRRDVRAEIEGIRK